MYVKMAAFAGLCLLALPASAAEPTFLDVNGTVSVDSARGVDPQVDYARLTLVGPWDDRNYQLTRADLALLADNEAELHDPIPAFFRVLFRRLHPETPRTGPVQYPRSALNVFRQKYGGYLVDGLLRSEVRWAGGRYYVDLSDGVEPSPAVGEQGLGGEVRMTSPNGAEESAVKINPVDPDLVIAGTNGPVSGQDMFYSTDGGTTWTKTSLSEPNSCCDPAVDWSSDGRYAYTTTLGSCGFSCSVWFFRSEDGGRTWGPRTVLATGGSDKEYLHVDKHLPSPYTDHVYVTWHSNNDLKFRRSTDFGQTWSPTITMSTGLQDKGLGSDITTDQNGRVFYLWPAYNSKTIRLARSFDGGATFGPITTIASTNDGYDFPIPAMDTRRAFIYVAADSDLNVGSPHYGSVYAAWTDALGPESINPASNHARIQVAYSRDGGDTWSVTTPHSTADQLTVDRFHPWLGVGPDGAVYVGFYDTREGGSRSSVDFYYSRSTDGGQTWSPPEDLTTVTSPAILDSFEWGDYNGLDVVMNQLITTFTDNRSETGGVGDSVDVYAVGRAVGTPVVCGNDQREPGEACDGTDLAGKTCGDFNCPGGVLACDANCRGFDTSGCTACVACDNDGVCDEVEDCTNCPGDCIGGTTAGAQCGNGTCEAGNGEDCLTCPADCAGNQSGGQSTRFCCGDGAGVNPVPCTDARCSTGGWTCTTSPVVPVTYCCGDDACNGPENCANCGTDCATSSTEVCDNGIDDDCKNGADCSDASCVLNPTCGGSAPGNVTSLTSVGRGAGNTIEVSFTPAGCSTNHTAYWGTSRGPLGGPPAWSAQACGLGPSGSATSFDAGAIPSGTLLYFVVVGEDGTAEGSYGVSSNGSERPEAKGVGSCDRPQVLGGC